MNSIFHHERIIHWRDLEPRHAEILEIIGWISPELHQMADALDRFKATRAAGLAPWIRKIQQHWPQT